MTREVLSKILLSAVVSLGLACIPNSALAQRGGGGSHGGGGFHGGGGGGGFHGGYRGGSGGGSYRSGGFSGGHYAAPGAGYVAGGYRGGGYAAAPRSFGGSYARPGSGGYGSRSSGGYANGGVARGNRFASTTGRSTSRAAIADGQWHSFGDTSHIAGGTAQRGSARVDAAPQRGASVSANGSGWHSFAANGGASRGLDAGRSGGNFATNHGGAPGFGANRYGRFGYGGRFGGGWGFGAWGWGFGWPWLGFYTDPFWYGPCGYDDPWDCPTPDLYYGPDVDDYSQSGPTDLAAPDDVAPPDANDSVEPAPQQDDSAGYPGDSQSASARSEIVLYLNDGQSFAVSDYWFSNGELYFDFDNGAEVGIDAKRLDVQRTTNENAKRGLQFQMNASPNSLPPAPAADNGSL